MAKNKYRTRCGTHPYPHDIHTHTTSTMMSSNSHRVLRHWYDRIPDRKRVLVRAPQTTYRDASVDAFVDDGGSLVRVDVQDLRWFR